MHLDNGANDATSEKPSNKYYETDMKHTVQYPRLFLGLLGVWPMLLEDSSITKKYFRTLLKVVFLIVLAFVIVPPILHIILREKDSKVRLQLLGPVSYHLTNFLKYGFFVFHCETIKLCVKHVETDWMRMKSEQDRAIMMRNVRVGRYLTVICCAFVWTTGISYHTIMPLLSEKMINEYNETINPLPYPGFDILFDSQSNPTYEIIFCAICVSAFVSYNVTSASCSFTAGFVSHACGQIQVIVAEMETLVDNDKNENCDKIHKRISLITKCHIRVLRLSSIIEQVTREICFMEVMSSTLVICLVEYYLVTEWSNNEPAGIMTYLIGLIANILNVFMFCYIGEFLKEQGHQIGKAAYMTEWYKLPGKNAHDLMMIIIMDNYPPKITAGRIIELSISSFGTILKMSLTYCNVLQVMTN